MILNTKLHFHTEASRYDSTAKLVAMCKKAKELGYTTLGITEHGVLTNSFDFMDICEELGIKGIPGIEAYVGEHHSHLCLFPLTEKGYFAIGKAVIESYKNVTSSGTPVMSEDVLERYFGPDGMGHNEVVASSACVGGILANIYNQNQYIEAELKSIQKTIEQKKSRFQKKIETLGVMTLDDAYAIYEECEQKKQEISSLKKDKTQFKKEMTCSLAKEQKALDSYKQGEEGYEVALKKYEDKLASINKAKENFNDVVKRIEELQMEVNDKKSIIKVVKDIEKSKNDTKNNNSIFSLENKMNILENEKSSEDDCYKMTVSQAKKMSYIFGEGNFYVELQYHGIPLEKKIMPKLLKIAKELSLPTIITNDEHMVNKTEKELLAREYIRAMRFNTWHPLDKADEELYLKTGDELEEILSQIVSKEDIENAFRGCEEIANRSNVVFSKNLHYPVYPCSDGASEQLVKMCYEGIKQKYKKGEWTETHQKRLEYELDVIVKMGYADYHCITADYIAYGKVIGKIDFSKYQDEFNKNPYDIEYLQQLVERTDGVGEGVGPGRGSAAGSMVCYLTGITDVDPIKYNLLFERFLNVERVTMPDIDVDFSPEIREKVIDYVRHKYGEESVCMILTFGLMKTKKSIRNVARIHGLKKKNDKMYYASLADEITKGIEVGETFNDILNDSVIKSEDGTEVIRYGLLSKYQNNPDAIEILNIAKSLENCFVDYGMHAAGVVIADSHPVSDYVPLMCNDGENWVSQCAKERVEDRGLLKMDFLGLKNLRVITNTLRMVQRNTGKRIDINKIPLNDKNVIDLYAKGHTNAVFQVESEGMKSINKDFAPTSFEDIILIIAAYRPGPMSFIPDIIKVKKGLKTPNYPIQGMGEILDVTYGCPVYQEQIMEIFHRFAGFSLGKADIIRRYMSKKKVDAFLSFKDDFVNGFIQNGSTRVAAEEYWDSLVDFSKYAFNKSHATAYALVSYQTAWLKYYYPREFISCYLSDLDTDGISKKIKNLIIDLKEVGYNLLPPDINYSEQFFSVHKEQVIYGLASIRGVNNEAEAIVKERLANGLYTSIFDFVIRVKPNKTVLTELINSGAFDGLCNRYDAMDENFIDTLVAEIASLKKQSAPESIRRHETYIKQLPIPHRNENEDEVLSVEKHALGTYVSKNPLKTLPDAKDIDCDNINEAPIKKNVSLSGMISDCRIVGQKKDGRKIAFFQLEDKTGDIPCCCFADAFALVGHLIKAGNKVIITGNVKKEIDNFLSTESETVEIKKMYVQSIKPINKTKDDIIICVDNVIDWVENVYPVLKKEESASGHSVVLLDKMTQRIRVIDFKIKELPKELLDRKL